MAIIDLCLEIYNGLFQSYLHSGCELFGLEGLDHCRPAGGALLEDGDGIKVDEIDLGMSGPVRACSQIT
jgi:hypothetical protein